MFVVAQDSVSADTIVHILCVESAKVIFFTFPKLYANFKNSQRERLRRKQRFQEVQVHTPCTSCRRLWLGRYKYVQICQCSDTTSDLCVPPWILTRESTDVTSSGRFMGISE